MTNLSPAAQQVFWEFNRAASGKPDDWHYLPSIAAALRAVTDQVIPEMTLLGSDYREIALQEARQKILAIADELDRE